MIDEQAKEYAEVCEQSSNLNYPLVGCIMTPFCKICKNYRKNKNPYINSTCKVLGEIPPELIHCKKYECEHFVHDTENINNIEFDENLKPLITR